MEKISLKKLIREILEEGQPSLNHERLKKDLAAWAHAHGFTKICGPLPNNSEPDVLRASTDGMYLFLGDAKNSENETADTSATIRRIQGYFHQFASLLKQYTGGCLAIATDSYEEALRWISALNVLANNAMIISGEHTPPDFRVIQLEGKNTWIIYW